MSTIERMTARIGRVALAFASSLTFAATPATAPAAAQRIPEAKAFVESVQSGALNAEDYDFDRAGFFRMSPQERQQWQGNVFGALAPSFQPGSPQCTAVAQRNRVAGVWVQIAGQSKDADEWQANVRTLHARLLELDQLVDRSAPEKSSADPLVQELLLRYARDQAVRSNFSDELKWSAGLSPDMANSWILATGNRMAVIDCDNTAWLKTQLIRIGWFTIPKYGTEADMAAWHLVQHADKEPSFQREMLDKLLALPPGQTNRQRLGLLFDRVALAEGHLQRYGTGGQCKDGHFTPFESEDPDNLDKRRASLGMEPIADYIKTTSREACPH